MPCSCCQSFECARWTWHQYRAQWCNNNANHSQHRSRVRRHLAKRSDSPIGRLRLLHGNVQPSTRWGTWWIETAMIMKMNKRNSKLALIGNILYTIHYIRVLCFFLLLPFCIYLLCKMNEMLLIRWKNARIAFARLPIFVQNIYWIESILMWEWKL